MKRSIGARAVPATVLAALGVLVLAGALAASDSLSEKSLLLRRRPISAGNGFATLVFSGGARSGTHASTDSADVVAAVERYRQALASGDSATALALLASDVVILESGGLQTRDEYRAHHLAADIAFARAVPSVRGPMRVVIRGDAAWTSSTTTARGEYRGRQINSAGAELMVLSRESAGWKIRAIHWSSRAPRTPGN